MNEQINGTAAEIEAARGILDEGGIPPDTYWYQAIVGDEFGSDEHVDKSNNWVTCACGERCTKIAWDVDDEFEPVAPSDFYLCDLGVRFGDNCDPQVASDFGRIKAAQTLVAIEKRVQELEGVG